MCRTVSRCLAKDKHKWRQTRTSTKHALTVRDGLLMDSRQSSKSVVICSDAGNSEPFINYG